MSSLFEISDFDKQTAAVMHFFSQSLIEELYAASREQGISQNDIAEKLEVHKSAISRFMQGRGNPTLRTVSEMLVAAGVRPRKIEYDRLFSDGNHGNSIIPSPTQAKSTSQKRNPSENVFIYDHAHSGEVAVGNV